MNSGPMKAVRILPLYILASSALCGQAAASAGQSVWLGLGAGVIAGGLPMAILGLIHAMLPVWQPVRPQCRSGACSAGDYELLDWRDDHHRLILTFRCRCGGRYVRRGGRFLALDDQGNESPYLALSAWGRWERDPVASPSRPEASQA